MKYLVLFENFDTKSHLKDRGVDTDKTRVIIDDESGDSFFFLYNLTGQMVGYQKYNQKFDKKGQNSKTLGDPRDTKYYNWVGSEDYGKKVAVWGLETYKFTDKYIFITEGIFDIARAHQVGYPGIAVLCNDPAPQIKKWLETLPQTKVVIYDNDKAGEVLRSLGNYSFSVESGKDLNDLSKEDAKIFLDDIIRKIESGINESNSYSIDEFRDYIVDGLTQYLRPVEIKHMIEFYTKDIIEYCNSGKMPKLLLDKIISELDRPFSGDLPAINMPKQPIVTIKYL